MRFAIAALIGIGAGASQGPLDPAATSAQATRTQWDGIFTDAQANRGAPLFEEHCIVCHGGGMAPDLIGAEFNSRWDGYSIGELLSLVQTAMPQQQPGSLMPQQYTDIVAHVLQSGGFPAGQVPLQPDAEMLGQVIFVATRPPSSVRDVTLMPDDVFERLFARIVGTWEFKADKSTYTRRDPPQSWFVIYEPAGTGPSDTSTRRWPQTARQTLARARRSLMVRTIPVHRATSRSPECRSTNTRSSRPSSMPATCSPATHSFFRPTGGA